MARRALLAVVASALVVSGCNAGTGSVPAAPGGTILVADEAAFGGLGGVIRVNPATGAQTVVSSGVNFVEPTGIAIAANGDILVADPSAFGGGGGGGSGGSSHRGPGAGFPGGELLYPPATGSGAGQVWRRRCRRPV